MSRASFETSAQRLRHFGKTIAVVPRETQARTSLLRECVCLGLSGARNLTALNCQSPERPLDGRDSFPVLHACASKAYRGPFSAEALSRVDRDLSESIPLRTSRGRARVVRKYYVHVSFWATRPARARTRGRSKAP